VSAPVILLHGWTMTGDVFAPLVQRLAGRCLMPDLPGHGAPGETLAEGVALLGKLIATEGLEGVTLVGWSMGALIGWRYLAQGGTGVARMVSLDMSPCPLPGPDWSLAMRGQSADKARRTAGRLQADWPGAARAIAQGMFARPEGCAAMSAAEAEARILRRDPAVMARLWSEVTGADLRAELATIRVPLLALHGAQSRVYPPEVADWIARAVPEGQAQVLPGCGHAPHLEDPGAVAAAIEAFRAEPAPGRCPQPRHGRGVLG